MTTWAGWRGKGVIPAIVIQTPAHRISPSIGGPPMVEVQQFVGRETHSAKASSFDHQAIGLDGTPMGLVVPGRERVGDAAAGLAGSGVTTGTGG